MSKDEETFTSNGLSKPTDSVQSCNNDEWMAIAEQRLLEIETGSVKVISITGARKTLKEALESEAAVSSGRA